MSNGNLETRTLLDELKSLEKGWFFDFGHPLVNRVAESFVKAAGIGAIQAVSREAYFTAVDGPGLDSGSVPELPSSTRRRFPGMRGENTKKSLEEMVKITGKESFQWGLAAGMYSGLTYGLREARGSHDWEVADNNCVYRNEITHDVGERTQVLQDVTADPTLPRTKTVRCAECNHPEAVFFQATARGEEGMALFFVCCNPACGHRWRD